MKSVVAFSIAVALGTIAFGAAYPLLFSTSTPTNDIVDFYYRFLGSGGFAGYGLKNLYAHHNEHRLVVPRLWFIADILLVQGRQTFLLLVIFVSALLHAVLLAALFRGLGQSKKAALVAFALAAAAMVSPVQYENLLQGFQVQFVQVWLFATFAFALIAWAPVDEGRPVRLGLCVVGAVTSAILSTYSMFNGLAVWPLMILFVFWRRLPLGWCLLVLLIGGALLAIEISGFLHRPRTGLNLPADADAFVFLLYMARYLTSGIGQIGTLGQEIVGVAAILGVVAAGVRNLLRPGHCPPARMAMFAVCGFILVAAFLTALGRLQFGLGSSDASRYTTPSMVFLMIVGMLVMDDLLSRSMPRLQPPALGFLVVLFLVPGVVKGIREMPTRAIVRDLADLTIVSHLAGGYRPEAMVWIYPHWPPHPAGVLDMMRSNKLGPFSELERFQPPASVFADGPAVAGPLCEGAAERLQIDPVTGVTFAAWMIDPATGRQPPWVVGRTLEGKVIAWGKALDPRLDRVPIPHPKPSDRGYQAFGDIPDPGVRVITVEGVFGDGSRCRLAGTVSAAPDLFLAELPAGATVALAGPWTFDGGPLDGGTGPFPVPAEAMPAYGSFGKEDRRFDASIELGDPGGASGVLLPILTNRWPHGTTIELLNPAGQPVAQFYLGRPAQAGWLWLALRPTSLEPGMRLTIRTTKRHEANNVAFGTPHWLP